MFKWVSNSGEKSAIMGGFQSRGGCLLAEFNNAKDSVPHMAEVGLLAVQQPTQQFRCYNNLIPDR